MQATKAPAKKTKAEPTKTRQVKLLTHNSPFIACRFDPNGNYVFATSQDSQITRWELDTGKKTTLKGHESWVRGMAFTPDGKTLLTGDYHGRLIWWSAQEESPKPARNLERAHDGWLRAVAVSPDGKTAATCGNDHVVKLWNVADGKCMQTLIDHQCHVYNVGFHPDGKHLVSGDLKGIIKQWDVAKGEVVREFDGKVLHKYDKNFRADIGGIRSMDFSPDGKWLACSGITDVSNAFAGVGKPLVVLFDWQTGKRKQLLRPKANFQGTAWGVACHPEGFIIGCGGGRGGALWFWKPEQTPSFHTLKLPRDGRDMDLHADGLRLAVAFSNNRVGIYEMAAAPAKPKKPKKK